MGHVYIDIEVCGEGRCRVVKALVDTGATLLTLTKDVIDEIKPEKHVLEKPIPFRRIGRDRGEEIQINEIYVVDVKYRDKETRTLAIEMASNNIGVKLMQDMGFVITPSLERIDLI